MLGRFEDWRNLLRTNKSAIRSCYRLELDCLFFIPLGVCILFMTSQLTSIQQLMEFDRISIYDKLISSVFQRNEGQ